MLTYTLLCRFIAPNMLNINPGMSIAKWQRNIVRLTEDERIGLDSLIYIGKVAAHKRLAEIRLKADMSDLGAKWNDGQISEASGISTRTFEQFRKRLVQKGLEAALNREPSNTSLGV